MNSLRPTSVSDTTLLNRLESQSSSSEEPSTPIPNGNGNGAAVCVTDICNINGNELTPEIISTTTTNSTTLSLTNSHNHNHNHNCNHNNQNNHNNNNINNRIIENHLFINLNNDKRKMNYRGIKQIFARLFYDLLILCCVGLPIFGFHVWGDSYKRGFFCDDVSLKHPFKSSTVRSWMLYFMGLVLPISIITFVEFFKANTKDMRGFGNLSDTRFHFCHLELPDWIVKCYNKIGVLIFGAGIVQLTTDIAKYSIGRLRPHFFAICQPLLADGTTCNDAINVGRYIENFTCNNSSQTITRRLLKEVRLSFPSGHASFAFFTMIYIAIYLQQRMTWKRSKMFKHLLQFMFLMFAWFAALTRVSDYKHHWTDVLAGSLIGTIYAILATSTMW